MSKLIHIIFVVIINIICWGGLIGYIIWFFRALWANITGKGIGSNPFFPWRH